MKKKPSQDSQEEPKDENEIKEVPSETKPSYQRFYKSKSFIPKFKGKSIKSWASSLTIDSSLNNYPLSSSRNSEGKLGKKSFDIE